MASASASGSGTRYAPVEKPHHVRLQPRAALCLRIGQNRDAALGQNAAHVFHACGKLCRHVLHLIASV